MTQLAANVNADAERWTLDSLPSTQYVQVDDETVEVRAMFPSSTYSLTGETLPPRIRVRRGIAGTTKASHLSGATLTPNYGLGSSGGGGGAIAVTGTEGGEVTPVTAITVATVVDEGGGIVAITPAIVSDTQPAGPLPRGTLWIGTDADATAAVLQLRVWNPDIEGFEDVGLGDLLLGNSVEWTGFSASGTEGNATFAFGGNPDGAINLHLKDEDGSNDRHYRLLMGNQRLELSYVDPDAVSPDNSVVLNSDGITFTGGIGFYGGVPIAAPVVPLTTPDAQDVIDALVALGLVTQSD